MDRAEAVALVRRIMAGDYSDEAELLGWFATLGRRLGCPHLSDLIFHPNGGIEPTKEEVVDRAPAYQPIAL